MPRPIKTLLTVLTFETVLAAILFVSARRVDLPWVWALIGAHGVILFVGQTRMDPDLVRERRSPGPGAGRDKLFTRAGALLLLVHLVIAGLDVGRFHWSPPPEVAVRVGALAVFAAGMSLSMWAMAVNRFSSSVVRIQTERGHHVVDAGPYQYVRHPGYLGVLVSSLAGGVVIGSWWSLVPLGVLVALFAVRLHLEDRFLHRELDGYAAYAGRVRYRLVPGVW